MPAKPADAVLEALIASIKETRDRGVEPLLIFDLDGTLYDNTVRTLRILQEFAASHANTYEGLVQQVAGLASQVMKYKLSDTLLQVGITDEGLVKAAEAFWFERFFTDDYVTYDLPTPGAREFVEALYEAGGVPVYLTGRDAPNMLVGTVKSLHRDGFPVGTFDTRIVLKDDFHRADHDYKKSVIDHLKRVGHVVGAFDNEPGLCNLFKEAFPEAEVVWLDTSHAPGAPDVRDDITTVGDFTPLIP